MSKKRNKRKRSSGPQAACPKCGRRQPYTGPDAQYYCPACGGMFDNEPGEGGDYFADPTKRAELAERPRSKADTRPKRRSWRRRSPER